MSVGAVRLAGPCPQAAADSFQEAGSSLGGSLIPFPGALGTGRGGHTEQVLVLGLGTDAVGSRGHHSL